MRHTVLNINTFDALPALLAGTTQGLLHMKTRITMRAALALGLSRCLVTAPGRSLER